MTELLVQNKKILNSSTGDFLIFNFGIPAYQAKNGLRTCPAAGVCAKGCYAKQGAYVWPIVAAAYEYRLAITQSDSFLKDMQNEIDRASKKAIKQGKKLAIRIHDSGDFYSIKYFNDWLYLIQNNPGVLFYAYTKQVIMLSVIVLPNNFRLIFSEGGLFDRKITGTVRHSRVFSSLSELISAGYDDASHDDTIAFTSISGKIGLIYHGAKSKQWSTGAVKKT